MHADVHIFIKKNSLPTLRFSILVFKTSMAYENPTTCHEIESHRLLPMWILFPALLCWLTGELSMRLKLELHIFSFPLHIPFPPLQSQLCVCVFVHIVTSKPCPVSQNLPLTTITDIVSMYVRSWTLCMGKLTIYFCSLKCDSTCSSMHRCPFSHLGSRTDKVQRT